MRIVFFFFINLFYVFDGGHVTSIGLFIVVQIRNILIKNFGKLCTIIITKIPIISHFACFIGGINCQLKLIVNLSFIELGISLRTHRDC